MGIQRAIEKIKKANIVLYLIDARDKDWEKKFSELQEIIDDQYLILVVNKIDLVDELPKIDLPKEQVVYISAKYQENIKQLEKLLLKAINYSQFNQNDIIITNARHYEALKRANEAVERVIEGLKADIPGDLLAQDIREVMFYLGEITGEISTDEILQNIFKNFCIGK
jgi:tRNA modification GTPase